MAEVKRCEKATLVLDQVTYPGIRFALLVQITAPCSRTPEMVCITRRFPLFV